MSKTSIACIAFKDDKVLIAHRNPTGQMGGRWEFPGGKVEDGETEKEALVREFSEEFGETVSVGKQIAEAFFIHNDEKVTLHAWTIEVSNDGIKKPYILTEHTEYKWVSLKEIEGLNFVDSDKLIYPQVLEYAKKEGIRI